MNKKICSKCKKEFDKSFFFKNCLSKDGLTSECKICNYKKTKKWRENNKEHYNATSRKLSAKYRKEGNLLEKNKEWKRKNPDKVKNSRYAWYYKLKNEVFTHYSAGKPKCNCCGEKIIEFLALDHINGNGREHRLQIAKERKWKTDSRGIGGGISTWRWLKKNNYPIGFQILCHNCNQGKRKTNICPHKLKTIIL